MLTKDNFDPLQCCGVDLRLLLLSNLCEESTIHLLRDQFAICVKAMGIGICHHSCLCMPGISLYGLDVAPAELQFERGAGVPQGVKHHRPKLIFFDQTIKHLVDVPNLIRPPIDLANNQIVVLIGVPKHFLIFVLLRLHLVQFLYDEHFFLDASEMVNEVRLTNCEFVNCCWFLQFGNNLTMRQCKIVNAGVNFISNCAGKATITECEFCLIAKPDFFPEESYNDAISCSEAEMSRCSVQGPLKISSTASAAEKACARGYSSWCKRFFSWTTGTVTNCSFCGVKDLFALGGYNGSVTVSSCIFEQCPAVFWGRGPITVEDCRFENCTKIGTSLSPQSLVAYCQFNDCFCELFETNYSGGISIRFCEFNNWADGRPDDSIFVSAMLSFQKTRKDSVNSTVSDCVFNGMSAHYSFLIKGHAYEKIDGYAVAVEKCSFINCTANRESGKIIKIYDYYFPRLSKKRKEQTVTWVSNCRGLDQVNNGSNVNTDVVIKTKNSAGAKIGVALATVVAGVPGYVAASLITKAAADDDIHVE